jgi:hypothetical protein
MAITTLACGDTSHSAGMASAANRTSGSAGEGAKTGGSGASGFPFPGSLDVQVNFPVGITVEDLQYQITGPTKASGTVDPPNAGLRTFHIANLAPGYGSVTITASSVDGALDCTGTSPFMIVAGLDDQVDVAVGCQDAVPEGGSASACPIWRSIQLTPGEVPVGQTAQLTFFATGPAPSMLSYSVTEQPNLATASPATGAVSMAGGATTVTCVAPGETTLEVAFDDGPVPGGGPCPADARVASVSLKCDAAGDAGPPTDADAGSDTGDSADSFAGNLGAQPGADASVAPGQLGAATEDAATE